MRGRASDNGAERSRRVFSGRSTVTVETINELSPRKGALLYGAFMTLWILGFAGTDHPLPSVVVLFLLVLPAAVHFALGYVVRDWWALYLVAVPVVVAAIAGGLPSALWAAVVLLTMFPGAPLVALGVFVRERLEKRDPSYVDPWLI
jgi:hypothetical protein